MPSSTRSATRAVFDTRNAQRDLREVRRRGFELARRDGEGEGLRRHACRYRGQRGPVVTVFGCRRTRAVRRCGYCLRMFPDRPRSSAARREVEASTLGRLGGRDGEEEEEEEEEEECIDYQCKHRTKYVERAEQPRGGHAPC